MLVKHTPFNIHMVDGEGREMGEGRSPGLHWSTVVNRLIEIEKGKPQTGIPGEQEFVRMALGFVLEGFIEDSFKRWMAASAGNERQVVTQTELGMDGVLMTLDGIDYSSDPPVVEEYKATWKSMNKLGSRGWSPEAWNQLHPTFNDNDLMLIADGLYAEFWGWLVRIMGYCRAVGTTQARLIVLFVNGDYSYKPGHGPQMRRFDLTFTPEEIEDNWVMGRRMAAILEKEGVSR